MTLTVFEQRELRVGLVSDRTEATLNPGQAGAIADLAERMGARFANWHSPTSLRINQFVGFVHAGDLRLEILPKLDALSEPNGVRQSLLGMLAKTQDLEVQPSDTAGFSESNEPFIAALARLYCRRLLEALRRGLKQDYVLRRELLPHVRGKIDWTAQAVCEAKQTLEFNCVFDDRSEDTPLNRTLKGALLLAAKLLEGPEAASGVNELRHAMAGVADVLPSPELVARLRLDRTSRQLRPLLALAKLILGNCNPDLGRSAHGNRNVYAVVWDMNVLFEEYVGRATRSALHKRGLAVYLQESSYLAREVSGSRKAFLVTPDILVRHGRTPRAVIDTKWKVLDPRAANLGVSTADVYQVLAYAHRYETDVAVLVYPHRSVLGRPGVQKEFLIDGGGGHSVCVRIATLDLSNLETAENHLADGLFPVGQEELVG